MPEKLEEEEIQNILDMYERTGTYKETAEKTNHSKSTVEKYVKRRLKNGSGDGDSGASVIEAASTDENLVDLTDEELMQMSEAEFIETFFTEFSDMGVKDSFVQMISNQAQIRRQIPDEDQMSQRLQSHNSGVGNANDANAIAELYWALAQRYLRARGLASGMPGASGGVGGASMGGGEWVAAGGGMNPQQQNHQQNGSDDGSGDWLDTGPSPGMGQSRNQQPPQQGGGQGDVAAMMQQMMQQQQAMMQQMMEQQQEQENDRLREEIKELKREMGSDDTQDDSITDSLQEFMELQQMLDELKGDDDSSDRVEEVATTLQQQLHALQQEVRDDSSVDMGQMMSQGDSQFGLLAALAQSGDVDATEMVELAQQLGEVETHPDVAEKKYEKDIEEMKVKAEQEKWDSILGGLEELAQSVSSAVAGGDLMEVADEQETRAEPEVAAKNSSDQEDTISPAEQMVRESRGEDAAPEPTPEPGVEAEVDEVDGEPVVMVEEDVAEELDVDTETVDPDTEQTDVDGGDPQSVEADGGEMIVCPCGWEGDNKKSFRGHLGHCDEGSWEDVAVEGGE